MSKQTEMSNSNSNHSFMNLEKYVHQPLKTKIYSKKTFFMPEEYFEKTTGS